MKTFFFLAVLLVTSSVSAEILHIQCNVRGLPVGAQFTDSEDIPYQDIVSGDFTLDTEEVFAKPDFLDLISQHDKTAAQLIKRTLPCRAGGVKKSSLFGEPDGTRLQISAFQCGRLPAEILEAPYTDGDNSSQPPSPVKLIYPLVFMQKIIINGLPILNPIPENYRNKDWNLLFNEWTLDLPGIVSAPSPKDLLLEPEPPIQLPEGSFKFVSSDCKIVREGGIHSIDIFSDQNTDRE